MTTHAADLSDRTILLTGGSSGIGHAMAVGLAARGVTIEDVARELHRRAGTSGLDEKAARKK